MTSDDLNLSRRKFLQMSSAVIAAPLIDMVGGLTAGAKVTEKAEKKKTYMIGSACIGCHACFYACPQSAIHWGDDKYEIDQDKCIHCGTCYETCNISAVSEK